MQVSEPWLICSKTIILKFKTLGLGPRYYCYVLRFYVFFSKSKNVTITFFCLNHTFSRYARPSLDVLDCDPHLPCSVQRSDLLFVVTIHDVIRHPLSELTELQYCKTEILFRYNSFVSSHPATGCNGGSTPYGRRVAL